MDSTTIEKLIDDTATTFAESMRKSTLRNQEIKKITLRAETIIEIATEILIHHPTDVEADMDRIFYIATEWADRIHAYKDKIREEIKEKFDEDEKVTVDS